MISGGVPAGATTPNHEDASQPGSPASAAVGTLGSSARRCFAATASGMMVPALMCDMTVGGLSTTPSIWPAIRSITDGAAPR